MTAKVISRQGDPQDQTDCSTYYIPYKTYCGLCYCTTHCTDQIQASLENYVECLYIIDLVSVRNFYINR